MDHFFCPRKIHHVLKAYTLPIPIFLSKNIDLSFAVKKIF